MSQPMRLIITTVYEGIDHEWLQWFASELENNPMHKMNATGQQILEKKQAQWVMQGAEAPFEVSTTTYRVTQ